MSTMLPPPPKTLGMLSHVLTSSLASVQGLANPLDLKPMHSVCVLLVDGLGTHNLKAAGGHARYLNSLAAEKISSFFPSTTSTSLTAFATGLEPSETGFIAYQIFDRNSGEAMNLLSGWPDQDKALRFQPKETISEKAVKNGIGFHVCSQAIYENSGLTAATMRSVNFHSNSSISGRLADAASLLAEKEPKVIYLYVPELDQIAHTHGVDSNRWLEVIEELDADVSRLASSLGKNRGLLITADHGVIDIPYERHVYVDDLIPDDKVHFVGGDTRGLTVYLRDPEEMSDFQVMLTEKLSGIAYVFRPEDLVTAGYLKNLGDRPEIVPDIWIVAKSEVALFHRTFARKRSLLNIGHHGGFTDRELSIPLIKIGF
ncbi:MAG: alkaline phosphatase family protein [Rhodoluna sp.]